MDEEVDVIATGDGVFHPAQTKQKHRFGWGYQKEAYDRALKHVRCAEPTCAIDVGAHVGVWSARMCADFDHVIAFEPQHTLRECYFTNLRTCGMRNYALYSFALGNHRTWFALQTSPTSPGGAYIDADADEGLMVRVERFDELNEMPLLIASGYNIGLVKLDVEGFEEEALRGMEEMLCLDEPVVIFEEKARDFPEYRRQPGAARFLEELGAHELDRVECDRIWGWG